MTDPAAAQLGDALENIRVLDFTQNLPGPYATLVLASMGAEVIKVEPPRGDTARGTPALFEIVNAGKKSVVLDLKDPASGPRLRALFEQADVVVEGFRPGVMARFGCDGPMATERDPALVYCSISGYGQRGPLAEDPGHDLNFQALTGVCHMLRDASGHPRGSALPIADLSSAMTAVGAICAALVARGRTGRGRLLDVAMVDTLLSWAYVWGEGLSPRQVRADVVASSLSRGVRQLERRLPSAVRGPVHDVANRMRGVRFRQGLETVGRRIQRSSWYDRLTRVGLHALPHYGVYQCADGRWLSLAIVDEDKFWRALCEGLGILGVGALPLAGRFAGAPTLRRILARAFARHDLRHWLDVLDRANVPIAPVLVLDEALADPQLLTRYLGEHVHVPFPMARRLGPAPALGEHDEKVFAR